MNNNIMNKDIIIEFNCVSTLRVSGIISENDNCLGVTRALGFFHAHVALRPEPLVSHQSQVRVAQRCYMLQIILSAAVEGSPFEEGSP
jgi:hypothetical protein